ncbi:DUF4959 domain-containing protein [Pseudochryseolinea flava]|nr:DUF4959 domain-containing protein [Pseudochryseolinea flava]
MKKFNLIYAGAIALIFLLYSCSEELGYREPSGASQGAPLPIKEATVKNYNGKATIHYEVPADPTLLYVKAVYMVAGREVDVKASYYVDSLVVEGFADENEHEVKLFTVNRQEVASEPVTVIVKPLEAPIWQVLESIEIRNAFGGYKLSAVNKTKSSVGVLILEKNVQKEWEVNNDLSVFTSTDSIFSQVAGMDTIKREYAITVRDRWGNLTDTIYRDVTPIYETEIERSRFSSYPLPGDAPMVSNGGVVHGMWDNRYGWPVMFTTLDANISKNPSVVTVDMGKEAKVSKVWIRPFQEISGLFFDYTTLRFFELWGSTSPNPNGELDATWTKLGSYEMKKPSGSPGLTETPSDVEAAKNGFFFEANLDAPKIRFLRIKCLKNWSGFGSQSVDELRVFGDPR